MYLTEEETGEKTFGVKDGRCLDCQAEINYTDGGVWACSECDNHGTVYYSLKNIPPEFKE